MKKGQTSLEYLMVVVISAILMLLMWFFLSSEKSDISRTVSKGVCEVIQYEFVPFLLLSFPSIKKRASRHFKT